MRNVTDQETRGSFKAQLDRLLDSYRSTLQADAELLEDAMQAYGESCCPDELAEAA